MALESCHFTTDVWWRWNFATSLWKCGGVWILSLHCGRVVAQECWHFTVDVWWRWNVVTSLLMCGGAGMLTLHCGRLVANYPVDKQHFICLR